MSDEQKEKAKKDYAAALQRRAEYEQAVQARLRSPEFLAAPKRLAETIKDLESRGLLQYDAQAKHYDLHPVVRGVAAGGLAQTEKETYGQRVVDHFSSRPHNPYEQAETLEDVRDGLHVVRTLVQMGRFAAGVRRPIAAILRTPSSSISKPMPRSWRCCGRFFPTAGALCPAGGQGDAGYLANNAAIALGWLGQANEELAALRQRPSAELERRDWPNVSRA